MIKNIIEDFFGHILSLFSFAKKFAFFIIPKPLRVILVINGLIQKVIDSIINKIIWK